MATSGAGLTPARVVARCADKVAATIDEVTAIMSVEKAVYNLIDATGSAIWSKLATPIRNDLVTRGLARIEM